MNREILDIFREELKLDPSAAKLVKENLEAEMEKIQKELDRLYNDDALKYAGKIADGENYRDEIQELLNKANGILAGRDFSVTEEEDKSEKVEEGYNEKIEDDKNQEDYGEDLENNADKKDYDEEIKEDGLKEDYETGDNEVAEEYEKEPENNSLIDTSVELNEMPDDEYREEAAQAVAGRKNLASIEEVMEKGETSARLVMKKIQDSEKQESEEEKNQEYTHDYDKDERTR